MIVSGLVSMWSLFPLNVSLHVAILPLNTVFRVVTLGLRGAEHWEEH